jgi:transposase-like protein
MPGPQGEHQGVVGLYLETLWTGPNPFSATPDPSSKTAGQRRGTCRKRTITTPDQFKREAVELVRVSGQPVGQIAEEPGVSNQTLRNWVHAELRIAHGINVSTKRVARLMREARVSGLTPKKRAKTTIRVPGVRVADNLLLREFRAREPNRVWSADITYLKTWEGWVYLAAVQDLYSRKIAGWSMADHMRAELVIATLKIAVTAGSRRRVSSIKAIKGRNTSLWLSGSSFGPTESACRWAKLAPPTTTRLPRSSSPP